MRKLASVVAVGVVVLAVGGCVQTQVTKAVQVHTDVNGNITGYTHIESATQVGPAFRFRFEHLKSAPGDSEPLRVY